MGETAMGRLPGAENASKETMRLPSESGADSGPDTAGMQPMAARTGGNGTGSAPEQGN